MRDEIALIKQGICKLTERLENTVVAAANEVGKLGTTCSEDYANAILVRGISYSNIARIELYRFAPKQFPSPMDEEFQALINDSQRISEYKKSCYEGWQEEIHKVERIVGKYEGKIEIGGLDLKGYLGCIEEIKKIPITDIGVRIFIPGQNELRLYRNVKNALEEYVELEISSIIKKIE